MRLKGRVVFELQQRHVIGKPAAADAPCRDAPLQRGDRHQDQPPEVETGLAAHAQPAMRAKVAVAAVRQEHEPVIERAVEDVLAHVAPARRRRGRLGAGLAEGGAHVVQAAAHQPRMPVGAAALVGDPVGAQVALLEHMHGEAGRAGDGHRLRMDRPRVAVEHQVGDAVPGEDPATGLRPAPGRVAIGDVARAIRPEGPVARVEPHAPHLRPRPAEHPAEPVKERPVRPLQKEKDARLSARPCHVASSPVRFAPLVAEFAPREESFAGAFLVLPGWRR